ncbi:MOSC domain-containing protein 1, mitochondrial [Leucoagaricus sp. SymC.cos]|nr:MOSC domain-containing protein 1, mitochondrial [Leucoagaricus sp. SymC.cos]
MSSPNSDAFPLGLLSDKPGLIYTGLAAAAAATLLLVVFHRNSSTKGGGSKESRSSKMSPQVGSIKVAKILVHPIKSCRGTSVQTARYTPQGLENDRRWCVIDAGNGKVITAREVSKLVLITPRIHVDETSPDGGSLVVNFPEDSGCETFSVPLRPSQEALSTWTMLKDIVIWPGYEPLDGYICQSSVKGAPSPSEVLSKYIGRPVHLTYKGPLPRAIDATYDFPDLKATAYFQDMYPLLLMSEENAQAVEEQIRPLVGTQGIERRWEDATFKIERFRPNIVLKGGGAFVEDGWEEIGIGSKDAPAITLVSKCTRCLLPNVDPETGVKDAAVPYKVIMKFRKGLDPVEKMKPCVGCNAVPKAGGTVSVGDGIYVKKMW